LVGQVLQLLRRAPFCRAIFRDSGARSSEELEILAVQLLHAIGRGQVELVPTDVRAAAARRLRPDSSPRIDPAAEWLSRGLKSYAYPDGEINKAALKAGFTLESQRACATSQVSDDSHDHGAIPLPGKPAASQDSRPPSTGLLHLKSSPFCVKIR
jgi:hypothetical protein